MATTAAKARERRADPVKRRAENDRRNERRRKERAKALGPRNRVAKRILRETQAADVVDWCATHCQPSIKEAWQPPKYVRQLLLAFELAPNTLRSVYLRKGCRVGWTVLATSLMARMLCLDRDLAAFRPTDRDSVAYLLGDMQN